MVVLRDGEGTVNQLIYKHAISTIVPSRGFVSNVFEAEADLVKA